MQEHARHEHRMILLDKLGARVCSSRAACCALLLILLTYVCFVLEEYVAFPAAVKAPVLSQLMGTELKFPNCSSLRKFDRDCLL